MAEMLENLGYDASQNVQSADVIRSVRLFSTLKLLVIPSVVRRSRGIFRPRASGSISGFEDALPRGRKIPRLRRDCVAPSLGMTDGLNVKKSRTLRDVILLNACAVRERPEYERYSEWAQFASSKPKIPISRGHINLTR